MRYFALACDFDGTLAHDGIVSARTLAALQRLLASGRKLVLVTGRQLDDLRRIFPQLSIFERVIAENGAVLFHPASSETKLLAEPPPAVFLDALRRESVPFSTGMVIVDSREKVDAQILRAIRELGLELQVIYNKGAAMVLPSGVNKATGVRAALTEMKISSHNCVGVGDAENDHALLQACECGVAVANSIETLSQRADFVTQAANGKGVEELIDRLVADDLRGVPSRLSRQPILLGTTPEGSPISVNSYDAGFVIAGPPKSGKTSFTLGLVERLTQQHFQVCLIDPEGDYSQMNDLVMLGNSERAPTLPEIFQLLEQPDSSVAINLLGLPLSDRPVFFATLLPKLQEMRAKIGRPHWIILDEAHHLLPKDRSETMGILPQRLTGVFLVTVHVDTILPAALNSITGIVALGAQPEETIRQFSAALGQPAPLFVAPSPDHDGGVIWTLGSERPVPLRVKPPITEVRRHKRKYAEGDLGVDRSFRFKGPVGKLNLKAHNLKMFTEMAQGVDDETWLYHLHRGDYSQWMRETIKDEALAEEVQAIEHDGKESPDKTRSAVIQAVQRRYTAAE